MTPRIRNRNLAFWSSLAVLPLGIGMAVGRRSKAAGAVTGALTALGLGALRWQLIRLFTEQPPYQVEERIGPLEIRRYPARIEARTEIATDNFDTALRNGFLRLARYIFGDNVKHEHLAMTAPVTASSERLSMTSPVIAGHDPGKPNRYTVAFVMPPDRAISELPTPTDERVALEQIPERRVAALRFRGRRDGGHVPAHEKELMKYVREHDLEIMGTPMFAGFDPPTTLPFLRRNEVWIELAR